MTTVSTAFTATGAGNTLRVRAGEAFTYTVTGSATASYAIQKRVSGSDAYVNVATGSADASATTIVNDSFQAQDYRAVCTAYTSGTMTVAIADVDTETANVGPSAGAPQEWKNGSGTVTLRVTEEGVYTPNLDVGASGYAGTVDIFPSTAAKGKAQISVTDQTGDTTVGIVVGAMAAARTITLADPGAAANLLTSQGVGAQRCARQTADVTATTNTTLANLTGLSLTVLAAGTYRFRVALQALSTANGGTKVAFKYTTATLTSLQCEAKAFTASAVAVARVTSTTDQASLVAATAANILIELEGTMVVNAAGTIDVQGAQNASHADTTTFYTGSTFTLERIA